MAKTNKEKGGHKLSARTRRLLNCYAYAVEAETGACERGFDYGAELRAGEKTDRARAALIEHLAALEEKALKYEKSLENSPTARDTPPRCG